MMTPFKIFIFLSILLCGLLSGLLYGYECSVIKGLGKLKDNEYLLAFQSINREIQNPWFFVSFMGTLLILPATSWLAYTNASSTAFYLILASALIYIIAVFGLTVAGNVPLNDMAANFDIMSASATQLSEMRARFEESWNNFHTIRTYASIVSFGLLILAVLKR